MSAENVYLATPGPDAVSTLKWISVRLVLPIVMCGTIAAGLQTTIDTTIAGGPKLAAADLSQLASLTPAPDEASPVMPPLQSAQSIHGLGDARHRAAAAMLLLLVATVRSKREDGEAQRRAAEAEPPVNRRTAVASQIR